MVAFNYISSLRTNCTPAEACAKCLCFPGCLEGTELDLSISGAGPDTTIVLDCIQPFTTCHYAVTYIMSFGNLNNSYTLDYVSSGLYRIVLSALVDANDVRANGIKVLYQGTNFADSPCTTCSGQLANEKEDYITKIEIQVTCSDDQMQIATTYYCTSVSRSRSCSGGTPSSWGAWGVGGTCEFSPAFCSGSTVTETALVCERGDNMVTKYKRGTMSASGCGIATDCSSPIDIVHTAQIVDA